ncbi:low molecular weight protein arginine phosphatase [Alkalicoccobacillus murimartini]|uniref:low molecular weight protein arginine phosphatase n=1 Tax=Alkalicoccobacillus murimartini TaxID=171685 RepID=UPI003520DB56
MKNILFVCTGNTCRSPMAEYLLKEKAGDLLNIQSAGVTAWPGVPISDGTARVLSKRGINHQHASQSVTGDLVEWADIILTMTQSHKEMLAIQHPNASGKVFTLKGYLSTGGDIADPIGGPQEEYEQVGVELDRCLTSLLVKWKE